MKIIEQPFDQCYLLEASRFTDDRGYFTVTFEREAFENVIGKTVQFVQDNESLSQRNTLRGLHYQKSPHAQAKLIHVSSGRIQDMLVDLREDSQTYGMIYHTILSAENKRSLFIPKGIAHGFLALQDDTVVHYKCDHTYQPAFESGVRYDDPDLQLPWLGRNEDFIVSEKDKKLPYFKRS